MDGCLQPTPISSFHLLVEANFKAILCLMKGKYTAVCLIKLNMNFWNLDVRRLYELWKTGRYQSYPAATLVDLVARILALVPPWTRVYRVQRDIPMPLVTSGVEHGNLRELALARMKDFGTECRDVRTREVGIQEIHNKVGFLGRVLQQNLFPISPSWGYDAQHFSKRVWK